MSERTATAFHEAGHAVVCVVLGGSFTVAALRPRATDGDTAAARLSFEDGDTGMVDETSVPSAAAHAVMTLAGPIAEARWIVGSGASAAVVATHRIAFAGDVDEEVRDLAPHLALVLGEPIHDRTRWFVEDHKPIAETLVAAYWPAIEVTARMLEDGRTLTRADVAAILYQSCALGTYPLAA